MVEAAKLTHYSSKPQQLSDSSRPRLRILILGDKYPIPSPTTKYPSPVCTRNVISCGVSYLCSHCSVRQNAAKYRRIKDCMYSSCSSPPTLPKPQLLTPTIATQAVDRNYFTSMKFKASGIGNKLAELGEFLEKHNVKVAVIHESKLSSNLKTPDIQNFTIVRKDRRQCQGGDYSP